MVVWITGLSGSGKSTLCEALALLLNGHVPGLVRLDGDAVRAAFGGDLGYGEEDRVIQIKRLQRIAKILDGQGLTVLVAALYAHPDLLAWNRSNFERYVEVYLAASLDLLAARDTKGLYSRAARREITDVVGVDIPWHAPAAADLVFDADACEAPSVLAHRVIAATRWLAERFDSSPA